MSSEEFTIGKHYSRPEIHSAVGGSLQSFLPHVDGRVVAACLRLDLNPEAPLVILPGSGQGIEYAASLLARQSEPVPTFLRRGSADWEYVGNFKVARWVRDQRDISVEALRSRRSDITMVLNMVRVGPKALKGPLILEPHDQALVDVARAAIRSAVKSARSPVAVAKRIVAESMKHRNRGRLQAIRKHPFRGICEASQLPMDRGDAVLDEVDPEKGYAGPVRWVCPKANNSGRRTCGGC